MKSGGSRVGLAGPRSEADRRHASPRRFGGCIGRESSCDISGHCLGGHRGAAWKGHCTGSHAITLTTALLLVTFSGRLDSQVPVRSSRRVLSAEYHDLMSGAIAGTYDLHALRAHLAVAIMSVALSGRPSVVRGPGHASVSKPLPEWPSPSRRAWARSVAGYSGPAET